MGTARTWRSGRSLIFNDPYGPNLTTPIYQFLLPHPMSPGVVLAGALAWPDIPGAAAGRRG